MTLLMRDQENIEKGIQQGIQQGREEGIARMCKLQSILLKNKRYDDLKRSAEDDSYCEKLLKEYDI